MINTKQKIQVAKDWAEERKASITKKKAQRVEEMTKTLQPKVGLIN